MSILAERPVTVMWSMNGMLYVMMEMRPSELERICSKYPDMVGIPQYYAIEDDDVKWWPSCKGGWPVVGYDR